MKEHFKDVHDGNKPIKSEEPFQKDQTIKEPIKCNICGFTFKIKSQLYGHITSMHSDKKPFKCNSCNAKYSKKQNLDEHIYQFHQDTNTQSDFKCEVCQTIFSKISDLEVHISMVHEEKKPYRCGMCSVKYAEKHPLHRHMVSLYFIIYQFVGKSLVNPRNFKEIKFTSQNFFTFLKKNSKK